MMVANRLSRARRQTLGVEALRRDAAARLLGALTIALLVALSLTLSMPAYAVSKADLNRDSQKVLNNLLATEPAAKALSERAVAVLVFPSVKKGGFLVGGQYGEGVLWRRGKPIGYYSTAGASYGLQAGVQVYGYALFFMAEKALKYLESSEGFEVGVGPSVVVVDSGTAKSVTTTTAQKDIYAFIFSQKGLMAGVGVQGNKITELNK
jgi:lipid-binding SYLF domain-containing protein